MLFALKSIFTWILTCIHMLVSLQKPTKLVQNQRKPNTRKVRLWMVKAPAEIIREDIRAQVDLYETTQYTPFDNFLQDVNSVILESVQLLFKTIIQKNKRNILDKWSKKCVALSHALITAEMPRFFISSFLYCIGVYLYQTFESNNLWNCCQPCGFHHITVISLFLKRRPSCDRAK